MNKETDRSEDKVETSRIYEPPAIKVMDETEVLKAFQITSAGMSWWG